MESKYSPGPWEFFVRCPQNRPGFWHNGRIVFGADKQIVCDFGGGEGGYDQSYDFAGDEPTDADLALILAAPRMYELLSDMLDGAPPANNMWGRPKLHKQVAELLEEIATAARADAEALNELP